jgi:hypothetical protein
MSCLHVYKRLLPEVPGRVWRRRGPASAVPRTPGAEGAELALEFGEHPPSEQLSAGLRRRAGFLPPRACLAPAAAPTVKASPSPDPSR